MALLVGVLVATEPGTPGRRRSRCRGRRYAGGAVGVRIEPAASAPASVAALARSEAVSERALAGDGGLADRRLEGGLRGRLCTLIVCWTLLVVAGAVWRRRLVARDLREWSEGWSRVEPGWRGRTV